MTKELLLNKLKTEKICPSQVGLVDIYKSECESDDYIVDCDRCREEAVEGYNFY